MTSADREQLAREHLHVAHGIAWKMRHPCEEFDEVYADALLGLARALNTWNGWGLFGGWAAVKIRCAILDGRRRRDHLTRWTRAGHPVAESRAPLSLNEIVADGDKQHPIERIDTLVDERGDETERALVREVIRGLPARQRLVVLLRQRGYTLAEIGGLLHVHEARVCQIQRQAHEQLRAQLAA